MGRDKSVPPAEKPKESYSENLKFSSKKPVPRNSSHLNLTKENLNKLEHLEKTTEPDYDYYRFFDILRELNLPDNLLQQIQELPLELQAYIIEEMMEEVSIQKIAHKEKTKLDHSVS